MPAGASAKREREYAKLKKSFEKEGRYKGREEEVAARIVNKQRSRYGETKRARATDRAGTSPDRGLPIRDYEHLTIASVQDKLARLSKQELRTIERYERAHKNRKTLLARIERARNAHGRTASA